MIDYHFNCIETLFIFTVYCSYCYLLMVPEPHFSEWIPKVVFFNFEEEVTVADVDGTVLNDVINDVVRHVAIIDDSEERIPLDDSLQDPRVEVMQQVCCR